MARQALDDMIADSNWRPNRRGVLAGASGLAASLILPGLAARGAAAPLSPERALESYRRMLCGPEGEEALWWFIGDIHYQTPGKALVPVARSLTVGAYLAGKASAHAFRYSFREAGAIVDLATGERLARNPLTGAPATVPLVDEPLHDIDWAVRDDGNIVRTQRGKTDTLTLRWTETSDNLLLLETSPGPNSFGLAPGDTGSDWKAFESTRTVYAKRGAFARPGFVPAQMIYNVAIKATPPWLANGTPGDHWMIVRGIGQKSRAKDIVNRDTLALVRQYFPGFL